MKPFGAEGTGPQLANLFGGDVRLELLFCGVAATTLAVVLDSFTPGG